MGRRAHSHRAALSLAGRSFSVFLSIRFGGATARTEKNRDDSFELRMESGGLHASIEESSRFFSVETVALPNLPQTYSEGASARNRGTLLPSSLERGALDLSRVDGRHGP